MADIFISHSGQDNEVAAAIGERIRHDRPTWSLRITEGLRLVEAVPIWENHADQLTAENPDRRPSPKSSRNAGRDQIGMVGDIIADSRATSPGIRIYDVVRGCVDSRGG